MINIGRKSLLLLAAAGVFFSAGAQKERNSEYLDFNYGQGVGDSEWIQAVEIIEPACRSDVKGKVTVRFKAVGMKVAKALCWSQPTTEVPNPWGHDVNLTPKGINLSKEGEGRFSFDAEKLPAGPLNVRIYAQNDTHKDIFELQLYNLGGVKWNQGIPDSEAPVAVEKGLTLLFSDDFDSDTLSISNDGRGARYNAHKPRFGDFSGWPFSDFDSPQRPHRQRDTYLHIAARKAPGTKGSTGLIASVDMDGKGFWVKAPFYMECRFTAQSAPGTWPAFWTINAIDRGPGDELDIVEAYGGLGKGNPNYWGYSVTSHFWEQRNADGSKKESKWARVNMTELGGNSFWSSTFHTYGLYVGTDVTIYYLDDIEVFRHPTNEVSRDFPHLFLINYAIGGISGWPIDLERYGNGSDMYVDYVRVYGKTDLGEK